MMTKYDWRMVKWGMVVVVSGGVIASVTADDPLPASDPPSWVDEPVWVPTDGPLDCSDPDPSGHEPPNDAEFFCAWYPAVYGPTQGIEHIETDVDQVPVWSGSIPYNCNEVLLECERYPDLTASFLDAYQVTHSWHVGGAASAEFRTGWVLKMIAAADAQVEVTAGYSNSRVHTQQVQVSTSIGVCSTVTLKVLADQRTATGFTFTGKFIHFKSSCDPNEDFFSVCAHSENDQFLSGEAIGGFRNRVFPVTRRFCSCPTVPCGEEVDDPYGVIP